MAKNLVLPKALHIAVVADKAYTSGQPVKIGQITGVAIIDAAKNEPVTLHLDGAWEVEVDGALTVGQAVYITTAGALTATKGENSPWGVAIKAKGTGKASAHVAPYGYIQA